MKKLPLLLALILFEITCCSQDCRQILSAGIYDISSTTSNTERARAFVNWFKSKEFKSYEEAKSYGASIGIPIEGIPVEFGFTADENGFWQFMKEIESYQFSSTTFKQKVETYVQKINPGVVEAWTACISKPGMHLWIEQGSDPKTFFVLGKYVDDGSAAKPKLTAFSFNDLKNIRINSDGPFISKTRKIKNKVFTGARSSQSFERIGDKSISVNVNASVGEGIAASFPALKPTTPYIRYFKSTKERVLEGETVKIMWDVDNATQLAIDGIGITKRLQGDTILVISEDRIVNLYAYNKNGQSVERIEIKVDKIVVNNIQAVFYTDNDDKDWDTAPHVNVFSANGTPIASLSCCSSDRTNDNWKDHTSISKDVPLKIINLPIKDLTHGSFHLHSIPNGDDDWHVKVELYVITSDGLRKKLADCSGNKTCSASW